MMVKLIDIGRVVVITQGRRAGKKAVVVDIIDENFVLLTGPKELNGVKRRRMNVDHIIPTNVKLEIEKGAEDEKILEAIKERGLEGFMREEIRIAPQKI